MSKPKPMKPFRVTPVHLPEPHRHVAGFYVEAADGQRWGTFPWGEEPDAKDLANSALAEQLFPATGGPS